MLKRTLEALAAILGDSTAFGKLIEQCKEWGKTQQEARRHFVSVLSGIVGSFEKSHALVLVELSKLSTAKTMQEYNEKHEKLKTEDLTPLFRANEICEDLHQVQADLASGFGDIKDAVILQSVSKLRQALGEFESFEYSLAWRYQAHLVNVLWSPSRISSDEEVFQAKQAIIKEQQKLAEELRQLTDFKRKIYDLSLY